MFKEERKTLTVKGNLWDDESRNKLVKQDMDIFSSEKMEINPTDMFKGVDKDGRTFYQLIDEKKKNYINVPSMDVEFFENLEDSKIDELLCGKHKVTAIPHKAKKSGRTYYELLID